MARNLRQAATNTSGVCQSLLPSAQCIRASRKCYRIKFGAIRRLQEQNHCQARTHVTLALGVRRERQTFSCNALRNIDWPEALLFDCDGVLVDTEAEGHRIAFNETFEKFNLPYVWSLEEYGRLLEIGGGKERMDFFFSERDDSEPWKSIKDPEERKNFLKELHLTKTGIFNQLIESGKLPVRPGVIRLINEAIDAGVKVAVCSTSNEKAVSNIVRVMLGEKIDKHMRVFAGDVVPKKKPSPDIYLLAAKELGVDPARCVVIEDSKIGLAAGKAAGMRVIVTESSYTKGEDFTMADAVFDCIGEAGDERFSLHDLTTPGR